MFALALLVSAHANKPSFSIDVNGLEIDVPAPSCTCKARFEIMHVQDFSRSFDQLLMTWKEYSEQFVAAFNGLYPDSRYGITGFVDKPLPWLGHGFGDYNTNGFRPDFCYQKFSDFVTVGSDIEALVQSLPMSTGGNDMPENQFEALINTALDPSISWTEGDRDADGTKLIKVAALLTNSTAHGINLAGKAKASGSGTWPDIPNVTRGWDLWWTAQYWDYSYGRDLESKNPSNIPYQSYIWPTATQFTFSKECAQGSAVFADYQNLGAKLYSTGLSSQAEEDRWTIVTEKCGPASIYDYIGMTQSPDQLAEAVHPGTFTTPDMCTKLEYPNQDQVSDALRLKNIIPIILTPETENSGALPWYQWAYGCTEETENGCTKTFYQEAFDHTGIKSYISAPPVFQGAEVGWIIEFFTQLSNIYNEQCECVVEDTTSTETVVENTTSTVTVVENTTSTVTVVENTTSTDGAPTTIPATNPAPEQTTSEGDAPITEESGSSDDEEGCDEEDDCNHGCGCDCGCGGCGCGGCGNMRGGCGC